MMDLLIYFSVITVSFYALVVLVPGITFLLAGRTKRIENKISVSVIVAARNEEKNITDCLTALLKQKYSGKWDIVLVDDHSEDGTVGIAEQFGADERLKILRLPPGSEGKKSAIAEAVKNSAGEILLFTDADCVMGDNWLSSMMSPFSDVRVKLTSGGVKFREKFRWNIFSSEQIGLQVMSAGMMLLRLPILLSGANYACRRELLAGRNSFDGFVSGDDISTLESARRSGKVKFVKDRDAIVQTNANTGLKNNMLQRARWVSKTGRIGNDLMRITGLVVFFANLVVPFLLLSFFIEKNAVSIGAFCLYSKILIDVLLLSLAVPFFREPAVLLTLPFSEIFYPFISFAAMVKGFSGNVIWKGRTWKR